LQASQLDNRAYNAGTAAYVSLSST
jgi:hypothetical protein